MEVKYCLENSKNANFPSFGSIKKSMEVVPDGMGLGEGSVNENGLYRYEGSILQANPPDEV